MIAKVRALLVLTAGALLAACGGGASRPTVSASCPPPPGMPTPFPVWLDSPPNASVNVATTIGMLLETGASGPGQNGPIRVSVTSPSGPVALGTATSAPSPLPSPYSTAPPQYSGPPVAIPLPTLSPNTSYTVSDSYTGWADNPPQCSATLTQIGGSFTTGP